MLDYRLLEAFASVISEKGFEKAAEKLCLTQSAVSQRVKQLEEIIGKILIRRSNPPEVTGEGEKLFRHFRQVDFLEKEYLLNERGGRNFIKFPVGINADSLGTWFIPSVEEFVKKGGITLEIMTADQTETDLLLKSGEVLGCISSSSRPIQGCRKDFLGIMRYIAVSSPGFMEKHFCNGITAEVLEKTPAVFFNRSDNLVKQFFNEIITADFKRLPVNYIPSYETFIKAIIMELGYGIVPEIQAREYINDKSLVNIFPDHYINLELFWHCWNIDSEIIKMFTANMIKKSAAFLLRP